MTMLERIARAIAESDASETDTLYYSYDQSPGGYQAIAIAAVKAMREPTEAMTVEGLIGLVAKIEEFNGPREPIEDGQILTEEQAAMRYMSIGAIMRNGDEVKATWHAAIDAILSEIPEMER